MIKKERNEKLKEIIKEVEKIEKLSKNEYLKSSTNLKVYGYSWNCGEVSEKYNINYDNLFNTDVDYMIFTEDYNYNFNEEFESDINFINRTSSFYLKSDFIGRDLKIEMENNFDLYLGCGDLEYLSEDLQRFSFMYNFIKDNENLEDALNELLYQLSDLKNELISMIKKYNYIEKNKEYINNCDVLARFLRNASIEEVESIIKVDNILTSEQYESILENYEFKNAIIKTCGRYHKIYFSYAKNPLLIEVV